MPTRQITYLLQLSARVGASLVLSSVLAACGGGGGSGGDSNSGTVSGSTPGTNPVSTTGGADPSDGGPSGEGGNSDNNPDGGSDSGAGWAGTTIRQVDLNDPSLFLQDAELVDGQLKPFSSFSLEGTASLQVNTGEVTLTYSDAGGVHEVATNWHSEGSRLTVIPAEAMPYNATMTLSLKGFLDNAGNAFADLVLEYPVVALARSSYENFAIDELTSFRTVASTLGYTKEATVLKAGVDGKWHTADDVTVSIEQTHYYQNGTAFERLLSTDAGADKRWFTADDRYDSYLISLMEPGSNKFVQQIYHTEGADNQWFTADDLLSEIHSEWTEHGVTYRTIADNAGVDETWMTADDGAKGIVLPPSTMNGSGHVQVQLTYADAGNDGAWFTADDTPLLKETTRFAAGQTVYQAALSAGADALLDTGDDELVSYSQLQRSSDQLPQRMVQYSDAGPDGLWETSDDVIAHYIQYTYSDDFLTQTATLFTDSGTDGVWFTSDDDKESQETYVAVP